MRILGIDPGTGILGFGVIDFQPYKSPKMIDGGVVATPAHTPLNVRLLDIYDSLTSIITNTKPDCVSIEGLYFNRNITTAISVAEARGVVILVATQHNLPCFSYTPLQIKQTLTGYGRAEKKQVMEMVRIQLGLEKVPQPDDAADALAAAITHYFMTKHDTLANHQPNKLQ